MRNPFRFRLAAQDPPPESKAGDSYFEKLMKIIPADIIAGYTAIAGILSAQSVPLWLNWAVFLIMLGLTPFYVCLKKTEPAGFAWSKAYHWITACIAFTAWVFAIGGPFAVTFTWYKPYLGSIVLILTTLIIPVLEAMFVRSDSAPPASAPAPQTPGAETPGENTAENHQETE